MKKLLLFLGILLTSLISIYSQVKVYAPAYPPLVIPDASGKSSTTGIATEVVLEASKIAGIPVEIVVIPWARAFDTASNSTDNLLIPVIRNKDREAIFDWLGPVSRFEYVVYRRAGSDTPKINSIEEFNGRIGSVTNDAATNLMKSKNVEGIKELPEVERLFLSLVADRLDYIVASPTALAYQLSQKGEEMSQIEPMFVLNVTPDPFNYLVIKKGSDSKLVDGFTNAIKQLQDSGKWDEIYKKYTE